ncbi:DNA-directed RNA polymerase III subunit RPC7 isoform X2 [Amia ocellicauda]|uniref:DNA-directed RNA polymerase III subunit RPC7 isoform X2 n=1 Tax=Amia ocellicauda TaxID=2972642 RepID=UPI003464BD81
MSGRGRGRGIASFTFNIEALGLTRGEALPEATLKPRPIFPNVENKPVPLKTGEEEDYMLALKQEMRETMKRLPYNIPTPTEKKVVERYKEMYTQQSSQELDSMWKPDWRRLPRELMPMRKKPIKPKKCEKGKRKTKSAAGKEEIMSKLEELEKKDAEHKSDEEEAEKKKKEEEGEEGVEGEEYDEEEFEEDNDYIASYFEDGDDYGAGSDENMDEGTY